MPYIQQTQTRSKKERILISGMPNTGKTTSLSTFIYGPYDYFDEEEREEALSFAENKRMIILSCPGEKGTKSLPQTEHITSYLYETEGSDDISDPKWSTHAIAEFNEITKKVLQEKPDVLAIDGFHALWTQLMNRVTKGDYLKGVDLNINPNTDRVDPYRSARFYSQAHNAFGQYITGLYHSSVPLLIATTWEEWQQGSSEQDAGKAQEIGATRFLWPAIPGKMALEIVGHFDARISARIEKKCLHKDCVEMKDNEPHYVWQFLNRGDVRGVGIKGLRRISKGMKQVPFVHQNYSVLKDLIEACS